MRHLVPILCAVLILGASPATSQTNLGVTAGGVFPVGDFADLADVSPYIGARCEIQDVNALGQVAALSVLVHAGFSFLQGVGAQLVAPAAGAGGDDDGSYFDVGAGVRVRSTTSPVFLGVGAAFVNLDAPDASKSRSGFGAHVGLGVATSKSRHQVEFEARVNLGILEGDDIAHFQALVGLGFPF